MSRCKTKAFVFGNEGLPFPKRCPSFSQTTVVLFAKVHAQAENDRSGFGKRPQWFRKTTAVVFENDRSGFGKRPHSFPKKGGAAPKNYRTKNGYAP